MLLIFIGYIFIRFHININTFDLLPDFLGFILIYMGLGQLEDRAPSFAQARPWALGLAVVSFVLLFPLALPVAVYSIISLLTNLANVYLLYLICIGVQELEQCTGQALGSDKMLTTWKVFAVCSVAAAVASLFLAEALLVPIMLLTLVSLVASIVMLVYLYRCHKALQQITDAPTDETAPWNE